MELNKDAVAEFLTLQYVLGDHTFRKGERAKRLNVPKFEVYDGATIFDVEDALKKSIQKVTRGKKKIGFLLSGGKDSRLLLGIIKSLGIDVTALTISDVKGRTEVGVAEKVAKSLGVPFRILYLPDPIPPAVIPEIIGFTDGLIPFLGNIPLYTLRNVLSKKFDIVVTGDMVTEIMDLCEYRWYESKDPMAVMRRKHFGAGKLLLKDEYLQRVEAKFVSMYQDKSIDEIVMDTEIRNRRAIGMEVVNKMGINLVAPVFDGEVIGATFSLPFEKRIQGRLATAILKKSYPILAEIRTSRSKFPLYFPWWVHFGVQKVKNDFDFARKNFRYWDGQPRHWKLGDFDAGYHLKYSFGDFVRKVLLDDGFSLDMLKPNVVKQVIDGHFSEAKDNDSFIGTLLNVKVWMDINLK